MILALVLAFAAPQEAPPPAGAPAPEAEAEEIVVQATFGRTTMLFDKGGDGKLRNCRVMVSSGSQSRDIAACQATPVCYSGTIDEVTDCTYFTTDEAPISIAPRGAGQKPGSAVQVFEMPKVVKPAAPAPTGLAGPRSDEGDGSSRYRAEKLPPPPTAPGSGGAVRVTLGPGQEVQEGDR
ncbi:hypothetical protein ACFQ1E_20490 [Sphingomonas canadensis]|uniref:Uncharacterized protein n=1 Tax=Sphingomonas canadensis TaxID=1219257 RepID=A0ABW3HBD1_9SPHN|nr:hypothetical protein [Sphingomonas canadensis]MCW3838365.1 hypothetical protein [Sphingomonas canadensis]